MKKILMLLFLVFSSIALVACGGNVKLEWVTMPNSVYQIDEMEEDDFNNSVSVKIGDDTYTIARALEDFPEDFKIVSNFNNSSVGDKVFTVKYKTLTLSFNYKVVDGETPVVDTIAPSYDWYDGKTSPYTLSSIEDLYGFANIVNGKDSRTADPFAGKTVKLATDIDLTEKVWEPIGAAPRKDIVELTYEGVVQTAPTEGNKIYFLEGKLQNNAAKDPVIRWGGSNNAPLIEDEADFVDKYNAAETLDERDGFFFIDSYVFGQYVGGDANATSINQFKFYTGIDNKVGNYFEGTFDGQGHKITGLSDVGYTPTVVFTYANASKMVKGYTFGLFGVVKNNVTVKNLTFEDVQVVGAYYDTTGGNPELVLAEIDSVGAAIGYAFGDGNLTIDNVKVLSGSITALNAAGGIVGRFYNTGESLIKNSENRANVSLAGDGYHVGGIAGYGSGQTKVQFINNTNYGNITASTLPSAITSRNSAGAMINYVGASSPTEFINCQNFGKITGTQNILGMVGNNKSNHDFDSSCANYGALHTNP